MITWIIGASGLFGQALVRATSGSVYAPRVPWSDPPRARELLHLYGRRFQVLAKDGPWRIIWAAGSATTSASREQAWRERDSLESLLTGLCGAVPSSPGSFFLTSSAGGVYAGSPSPPFDDSSPVSPLSVYGELKLKQEELVKEALGSLVPVVIGRVGNLYGPGQDLSKLQGLVSRLALTAVTKKSISIFVPLSTLRDYIYVDDAATRVLRWANEAHTRPYLTPRTVIVGSGRPVSVGSLIHLTESVARTRIPVALGSHYSASAQAPDLRLTPTAITGEKPPPTTPMPVGIRNVYLDILGRFQRGLLAG